MKNRNTPILVAFAVATAACVAFAAMAAEAQTSTTTTTTTYTTTGAPAGTIVATPIYATYSYGGHGTANGGLPNFLGFSNLTVGSRGAEVYDVQSFLGENGYFTYGLPTGYFGAITKSSLQAYQRSVDVPSTGYFGPLTRSAMSASQAVEASRAAVSTTVTTSNTTVNTSSNTSGISTSNQAPLSSTGYWYNGNWYSSVPAPGTTNISGYWINGMWTPVANTSTSVAQSNATVSAVNRPSQGYWYNGVWYPPTTGTTNASSSNDIYGMSTSHWNPTAGYGTYTSPNGGSMSCGYETMANGVTGYVCR